MLLQLQSWPAFAIAVAVALLAAVLVTFLISALVGGLFRNKQWAHALISRARLPFRVLVALVLVWVAVAVTFPALEWKPGIDHGFRIATMAISGWLLCAVALFLEDLALRRYRIDKPDNRVARRIRTQVLIVRRLAIVVIVVLTAGAILLTFPEVRTVGAGLLASAGLVSIVAGLAAQSILANMFAGLQLAFSDAIRVDDVVVVEGEWGKIGEITLSYVVVNLWDDRRLVLPCTYFTTTPFQHWTRTTSDLLGSVEFDLDWRVSPARMRQHLAVILERTTLWDRRTQVLQVTDATGGVVRVRILVTAVDAPTLFDLRCFVREEMVAWIQENEPLSLPRQRFQMLDDEPEPEPDRARTVAAPEKSGLFTGSPEAEKRATQMTGAVKIVRPDPDDRAP